MPIHYPFPPRKLRKKQLAAYLQKANTSLLRFNKLLKKTPAYILASLNTWEALASLFFHRIPLSYTQLLQNPKHPNAVPIKNYERALKWGLKQIRKHPFSKKLLCTMHAITKQGYSSTKDLGCYRNRQNWIGPYQCTMQEAYFHPPEKKRVPILMKQLIHYMNKEEKEPLAQLALIYAQFLIIHPFMDGNGRLSRILIPLFLYKKKKLTKPLFLMSGDFKKHRLKYFQMLFATSQNQKWDKWILFFLKALMIQTYQSTQMVKRLLELQSQMGRKFPAMHAKTVRFLFEHPVFTRAAWINAEGSEALLRQLKKSRVVVEKPGKILYFVPLINLLT